MGQCAPAASVRDSSRSPVKAVLLTRFGGLDVLRLSDVPTPSPAPVEILVRVHAVSVNRTWDLEVRRDGGGYGVTLPMVLGFDPSGVVEALGDGVAGFGIGDRVTVVRTVTQGGGAAEYIAAQGNSNIILCHCRNDMVAKLIELWLLALTVCGWVGRGRGV